MAISSAELTQYGRSSIDLYMKNDPIDSVNPDRPLLKKLMEKKKETLGGKQYLVKQVRKGNDSNFQSFYGSETVSYNRKDTLNQAKYEYTNFHDGFTLHEDDFIRNGVEITEGGPGKKATAMEKATVTNLFKENNETLRQGFEESLDIVTHTTSTTDLSTVIGNMPATGSTVGGLSEMIALDPNPGSGATYGTILRANAYWQNYAQTGVVGTTNALETAMREMWRSCVKYGGRPDCIFVGSTFLDAYIDYMLSAYGRVNYGTQSTKGVEGAEGAVTYQGVPLVWDPTFDYLSDNSIENTTDWKKRCYFINTKHMSLMPIKGQHMVPRNPPRVYNKYEYYFGTTTRFYLVNDRLTAHGVISIA